MSVANHSSFSVVSDVYADYLNSRDNEQMPGVGGSNGIALVAHAFLHWVVFTESTCR